MPERFDRLNANGRRGRRKEEAGDLSQNELEIRVQIYFVLRDLRALRERSIHPHAEVRLDFGPLQIKLIPVTPSPPIALSKSKGRHPVTIEASCAPASMLGLMPSCGTSASCDPSRRSLPFGL